MLFRSLNNKAHFTPVHILLYTLPGIPSVYYGSEFGIEGKKERFSDASLRPALNLSDYADAINTNPCTKLIAALGRIRQNTPALSYGDYQELLLTNRQYAFSRNCNGTSVAVTVNNDDSDYTMTLRAGNAAEYIGALSGQKVSVSNGTICVNVKANSGDIWVPVTEDTLKAAVPAATQITESDGVRAPQTADSQTAASETKADTNAAGTSAAGESNAASAGSTADRANAAADSNAAGTRTANESDAAAGTHAPADSNAAAITDAAADSDSASAAAAQNSQAGNTDDDASKAKITQAFEDGKIAGLQEAILAIMEKNGPVTDQMRRDVEVNVYHDSLINWIKSFR